MITITNDGPRILQTNYFDTEHAVRGFLFASWNAGALRLLVPDAQLDLVAEMQTGSSVVVTRGMLQGRDALEIMFDDGSDAPFAIHIGTEQTDRSLPDIDDGRAITVTAWRRTGLIGEWPGRYRTAASLPDMRPWRAH